MEQGTTATLVGQQLGGYTLTGVLGVGGMAEVYRATDPSLGREVAVKVLPASLSSDPAYVERFRDEAKRVAALNHPNIVAVYQFGEERGLLFHVMPVLTESLRDRLDREGPLAPEAAIALVLQIANALEAAHLIGLIHRDVKPENVLLDADGKALLTDFGIAREVSFLRRAGSAPTLAATGLPVGTPEYMSPEQLRALPLDQRADIYALGTVFYELLTGTVPYAAPTPYEVAALVLTAPVVPPSERNPAIWPQLEQVILQALAKDPDDRYADAPAFVAALHRAVETRGEPMVLSPAQALATVVQSVWNVPGESALRRRLVAGAPHPHRELAVALVAVALALIVAFGGMAVLGFLPGRATSNQPDIITRFLGQQEDTATSGGPTGSTPGGTAQTPQPANTAIPRGPTPVPGGATVTPDPQATAVPSPTTLPTAVPTATTSSGPAATFGSISLSRTGMTCTGTQAITSNITSAFSWSWQSISPMPTNLVWQLDGQQGATSLPNGFFATGQQHQVQNLTFSMSCGKRQFFDVTAMDSFGNPYNFTMQAP